ncbi:MAG: hypothetical protein ACRBB6_04215 [Neptuniibacter sp.]
MSEQDLNTQESSSPLDMSDDAVMNMDLFGDGLVPASEEGSVEDDTLQTDADIVADADAQDGEDDSDETDPEGEEEAEDDLTTEEDSGDEEEESEEEGEGDEEEESEEEGEGDDQEKETSEDTDEPDYEAQVKQILAPFKANGKDIQADSIEDAITLMKMGANYNKKMAALKPNLKIMRMLENQGLMDEGKLNFLIELDQKKPEAIQKLMKDSGTDPLDMNLDAADDYTPESYQVDDREIALDEVFKDIQDTSTYKETVELVSQKWDEKSREIIVNNPDVIRLINDHKQNGIYDQISTVIEKDRMLGKLQGLSDIEAYKQVGDRLHAEGKFGSAELNTDEANETVPEPARKPKEANPQLKKRKQAAGTPRKKPAKKAPTEYNPLAMSDDEFEKIAASQYM